MTDAQASSERPILLGGDGRPHSAMERLERLEQHQTAMMQGLAQQAEALANLLNVFATWQRALEGLLRVQEFLPGERPDDPGAPLHG